MKRILLFFFAFTLLFTGSVFAQTTINANTYYYFGGATGSFYGVGATPPELIGPNADNAVSAVTDIGFDFWLAGTKYTQFSVTEDGLMKLGSTPIVNEPVNNLASSLNLPKIAPYWDDLATGPAGKVVYLLVGTTPGSRYLVVQWNIILKNVALTPAASFQVRIYENGDIFFKSSGEYAGSNFTGQ
jgi:hypothetical protein